jgi:hypothetical protein
MWVVQEVAMAQANTVMFYCGQRMMRLETLSVAVDFTNVRDVTTSQCHWYTLTGPLRRLKAAVECRAAGRPLPPDITLTTLLTLTAPKEATLPVDKIFGLYSIAKHLGWHLPAPDYKKAVSQVFIEATQCAIQCDQSLGILNFAGRPTSIEGLPSWAADFDQLPHGTIKPTVDFAAARDSTPFFWFDATGRQMTLMGRMIDVVSTCGRSLDWDAQRTIRKDAVPSHAMLEAAWASIRQWIYMLQQHQLDQQQQQQDYKLNGGSLDEAFTRILFMDSSQHRDPATALHLYSILRSQAQSPTTQYPYSESPDFRNALEYAITSSVGKAFALTEGRSLAMVPATARIDDVVVIFAGSNAPFILRQRGEEFLFVGSAHVHGLMMDGERWTGDQADMQEFTLV